MASNSPLQPFLLPHINKLLETRESPKTFCPEVARALDANDLQAMGLSSWRGSIAKVRLIIAEMRGRGEVEVLQRGHVLHGNLGEGLKDIIGPIRVRKVS